MSERVYWLIGNRQMGCHIGGGSTATEAKAEVRASIAESFAELGELSPSACRRAASSYGVFVLAGPTESFDLAMKAWRAWQDDDWESAMALLPNARWPTFGRR